MKQKKTKRSSRQNPIPQVGLRNSLDGEGVDVVVTWPDGSWSYLVGIYKSGLVRYRSGVPEKYKRLAKSDKNGRIYDSTSGH